MIKNIEKVLNASEARLRYRKKETMAGLYFKEMLSKIISSKNKGNNPKDDEKENEYKKENESKVEKIDSPNKNLDVEGNFLDELC